MNKDILIIDNLNFFSALAMVSKFNSVRSVFYLRRKNGIFSHLAVAVLKRTGWRFQAIEYTLSPSGEFSPFKELEKLLIDRIKFCREHIFKKRFGAIQGISDHERARLATAFGRYAGKEMYFPLQLFVVLKTTFIFRDRVAAVLLKKNIFSDLIREVYQKENIGVYFYVALGRVKFEPRDNYFMDKVILRTSISSVRLLFKIATWLCYSILCRTILVFAKSEGPIKQHKICALVANTSPNELCSCLPWGSVEEDYLKSQTLSIHYSSMPKEVRCFYGDRSDLLIEDSFNPFIGEMNLRLIKAWSYFLDFFMKNIRLYRKAFGLNTIDHWISKHLLEIISYLSFYEALFRVSGTRVLWTMNEDDSYTQMAAMAINRAGGVSLGTTWSQLPFPIWRVQYNKNDISFVWGRRLAEVRFDTYDQCDSFVTTGYPADAAFDNEFKRARDMRVSIERENGRRNILTFIDNAAANDDFVAPRHIFDIYAGIFAWLEEDPANFLIIKAKRSETIDKYRDIKDRIEGFSKAGRLLIIYDRAVMYPSLAADVVVGASLTLPMLSAVLGRPVVFYDAHGTSKDYPLDLPNVYIVTKPEDIKLTISEAIENGRMLGSTKGLQPIRGFSIDPFVDGKAIQRMRQYIEDLLKRSNNGASNSEAIEFANARYKTEWGEDKVVKGHLEVSGKTGSEKIRK